jgi:hypothetical protein
MKFLKRFLILIPILLIFSCDKNTEHEVIYRISNSSSGFTVRYLNPAGLITTENITVQSAQDTWNYSFLADDGGIVFVSANYKDPESSIKVQILVDGKIYKQAATSNDTLSFVTVSGVIPIHE